MDISKLIAALVPMIGQIEADKLAKELTALLAGNDSWKKAILNLVSDAIKKHGVAGIKVALDAVHVLIKGEKAPVLDWADLAVASDILAELQNAEAGRRSAAKDFLTKVGQVLGIILTALIKGLI